MEETGSQQLKPNQGCSPDEIQEKRNPKGKRGLFLIAVCAFLVTCAGEGEACYCQALKETLCAGLRLQRKQGKKGMGKGSLQVTAPSCNTVFHTLFKVFNT